MGVNSEFPPTFDRKDQLFMYFFNRSGQNSLVIDPCTLHKCVLKSLFLFINLEYSMIAVWCALIALIGVPYSCCLATTATLPLTCNKVSSLLQYSL